MISNTMCINSNMCSNIPMIVFTIEVLCLTISTELIDGKLNLCYFVKFCFGLPFCHSCATAED